MYATGRPVTRELVWIDPEGGDGRIGLLVSAEKVGEVVLLRIDRMGEPAVDRRVAAPYLERP